MNDNYEYLLYMIYYKKKIYFERYLTPATFLLSFSNQHEIARHEDHACYTPQATSQSK